MKPIDRLKTMLLAAAISAVPAVGFAQVRAVGGDGVCPPGEAPVTFREAQRQQAEMCGALGEWDIARLADGGSMDGQGYGCQLRPADHRPLGHTLCAADRRYRGDMQDVGYDRREMAGRYEGIHPHWRDAVTLSPDGTFARGRGDDGRWSIEGTELVLRWSNWAPERLALQPDGSFRASSNGFTLRIGGQNRPSPPRVVPQPPPVLDRSAVGTYVGTHPHWRDAVYISPDGTYQRGSGDPGRWYMRGNMLMLDWDNWGTERLQRFPDGSFRNESGFTLMPTATRRPHRRHHRRGRPHRGPWN